MRAPSLLLLATASALAVSLLMAPAGSAEEEPGADDPGRLVLVLDSSGSMKEPAGGGTTKIDAARAALKRVAEELPDEAEVGVRVFGAEVFSRRDPGACTDTQNVVPVGPLDRTALADAVAAYRPYGETPIGNALRGAARDLGPAAAGERRTIVLLSDGEPTCAPDPCQVARDLTRQGIDLSINVVGLDVSGPARKALQCIAREGRGDYYDASSATELATSMVKVAVRPMRGFHLQGERVEGGTTLADPLPLEPGSYLDTSLPDEAPRYYLLDRPEGGGVSASALVRPPRSDENWNTVLSIDLLTTDGQQCASSYGQSLQVLGASPITATGTEYNQFSESRHEECERAEQMIVAVSSSAGPGDFRLRVDAHPAVADTQNLPEPLPDGAGPWVATVRIPDGGEREPVIGGVSFDDAPELLPGTTYTDTLRPSEQLVYRVGAQHGQAIRFSARLETDAQAREVLGAVGNHVDLQAFSALEQKQASLHDFDRGVRSYALYNGDERQVLTAVTAPVRVRNIESPNPSLRTLTHAGDQYFVLGMGGLTGEGRDEFVAPVTLRVELVGEPEGAPAGEADDAADGDASRSGGQGEPAAVESSSADGGPVLIWALGGGLVLAVLAAVGFVVRRSRSRA